MSMRVCETTSSSIFVTEARQAALSFGRFWSSTPSKCQTRRPLVLGNERLPIKALQRRLGRKFVADPERPTPDDGGLFESLKKRSEDLMGRAAVRVKEVARSNLLRQAMEARGRGNLAAAFYLAKEEYEIRPDEAEVANLLWEVAVAYGRPGDAVDAVSGLIERNVLGATEVSAKYWSELCSEVPDAMVDPSSLARVIAHLSQEIEDGVEIPDREVSAEGEEAEEDAMVTLAREVRKSHRFALRAAIHSVVDERNRELLTASPAMHVAELARELDPASALVAARFALDCEDVNPKKRDRLQALVAELDSELNDPARTHPLHEKGLQQRRLSGKEVAALNGDLPASRAKRPVENLPDVSGDSVPAKPSQAGTADRVPVAAVDAPIPIDMNAEAPVFMDIKLMSARPTGLDETNLSLLLEGERRSRMRLDLVQAIAVGEVCGLADAPVVIIDLLMNQRSGDDSALRLVRMRADQFDPTRLIPDEADSGAALREFLNRLLDYSHAVPLPDPEAALGLAIPQFDSLEAYEQQVLQVQR